MRKVVVLVIISALVFSGCTWFKKTPQDAQTQPKSEKINQVFYGFLDVPIPKELTYVSERSFVFETSNLKAGVMFFNGDVDMQSLENYFRVNLVKNGWRFINSYRYKDVVLNFTKDDKTCNIKMTRAAFNTEVEVWVGPADRYGLQQRNVEPK